MPIRTVRNALIAAALLLTASAQGQQPSLPALSNRVAAFMDEWLVQGNAASAVAKHVSAKVSDERLVPAEFYPPAKYKELMSGDSRAPLTASVAAERFGAVLNRWNSLRPATTNARRDVLVPLTRAAEPELWGGLASLKITPTELTEVPALSYRLRDLGSYQWVTPSTVGYRSLIPQMIASGVHVEGVISRIRTRNPSKAWMLFMFWSNDGTDAKPDWKLLGVSPVPTE